MLITKAALQQLCVCVAAGSVGAGSVAVAHKVRTAPQKASVVRAADGAGNRSTVKRVSRPGAVLATECPPVVAPLLQPLPTLAANPMSAASASAGRSGGVPVALGGGGPGGGGGPIGGGGGIRPVTLPTPGAAVPEADTWAMLIAGFGLVGLGLRRRKGAVGAG